MMINEILSINIDKYTGPEDDRGVDFSILNSVSTCPFHGIVRHILNKNFVVNERNMALECGDLCHKCFAVYRALSIYYRGVAENKDTLKLIGTHQIQRFFMEAIPDISEEEANDFILDCFERTEEFTTMLAKYTIFSDFIIDNSGYYDDPEDKKRTIANIKDSLRFYCSSFLDLVEEEPVWIENEENIDTKVGIEIPFDVYIKIKYSTEIEKPQQIKEKLIHFIGKLDGIHYRINDNNSLIIHENKTASRLDDSWLGQWYKSHQITGYCLVANYFTKQECLQARVLGMQIPAPKTTGYAFRMERVDRETFNYSDWARWVIETTNIIDEYKNIPEKAPMNTHACCKYYKQCAFIALCCSNEEERIRTINEDMVIDEWNPLQD